MVCFESTRELEWGLNMSEHSVLVDIRQKKRGSRVRVKLTAVRVAVVSWMKKFGPGRAGFASL
jgi:hypothetical protein